MLFFSIYDFVRQIAKLFSSEAEAAEGGSGGKEAPQRKSSKATNTLATKFKGNLTTLM